jgi:hypothetical protein
VKAHGSPSLPTRSWSKSSTKATDLPAAGPSAGSRPAAGAGSCPSSVGAGEGIVVGSDGTASAGVVDATGAVVGGGVADRPHRV